ncbi:MAG: hypothetical protein KME17_07370 [Cyanosarcina radialis HA8281-LM2]|jgi:protein phosphatase|nr:hypothetical protein [Cyanosarcina radialis HA8281-LM2]
MKSSEPQIDRHLWAANLSAKLIPAGKLVANRYQALAPQIWLDTNPQIAPSAFEPQSDEIVPYQRLADRYLHCPQVYGYTESIEDLGSPGVLLLKNVPLDPEGHLMPSIIEAWSEASPVRQVYWLWQMLQLMPSLAELNVASSLLLGDNLRVDGWRVRLLQLYQDSGDRSGVHNLQKLGNCWSSWFQAAQEPIKNKLQAIYQRMQVQKATVEAIAPQLNLLLLEQAAQSSLSLQVAAKSARHPDSCYPHPTEEQSGISPPLPLSPSLPLSQHLSIVCTPTRSNAEGATVSRWAVKSIQVLVRALLKEVAEQPQIMTPEVVAQQLEVIIRVTNNLLAARNEERPELRYPLGATLIMAIQLPQLVRTAKGTANAPELYIARLGDSHAYWLDARQIIPLTDSSPAIDPAEVESSATTIPQALGISDPVLLHPQIQRLIIEEDGMLLLSSESLSHNCLEQFGSDCTPAILAGKMALEEAVESLINLGDRHNLSVVLTHYRVSLPLA